MNYELTPEGIERLSFRNGKRVVRMNIKAIGDGIYIVTKIVTTNGLLSSLRIRVHQAKDRGVIPFAGATQN